MKYKTASRCSVLVGALLTLSAIVVVGSPQGVCVIGDKKVAEVAGVVLQPNNVPVPDATIKLHKKTDKGQIVAETKADANGRFQLAGIASGKYMLVVSYPYLVTLYIPLRVVTQKQNGPERELVITMNGLVGEPCGGGGVEVKERDTKASNSSQTCRKINQKSSESRQR